MDVTASADSNPSFNDNIDFGDISKLKHERTEINYAMLNLNNFVLDGSKTVFEEDEADIALWTGDISDIDCKFETNPVIDIEFESTHTSAGITINFVGDYPEEIIVTWYTKNGKTLATIPLKPDALTFYCKHQVTNYARITIELIKTRFPFEYIRVASIDYGMRLTWYAGNIKSAKVLEQVKATSTELSINTAEISILDEDNDFDIANENGAWKSVQKTQEVTLTEYIDDVAVPMGTFFLDDKSFTKNIASFRLIDTIGLMAAYTYYNGRMYNRTKAGEILEDIFRTAKIKKYQIDFDVYNTELTGWLAVQSCRDALKMICFVTGATADDARSDTVKVYKISRSISSTIPTSRKFNAKTKIKLDTYVSGVSIEFNKYELDSKSTEIYNDMLEQGFQTLTFSEPYDPETITASGCTIIEKKTNYVTVSVPLTTICRIEGTKYNATKVSYQQTNDIEPNEAENIVKLGTCTLINSVLLPGITKKILDYYALRKVVEMSYILETEKSGNWINIIDTNRNQSTTILESQNVDLTGGFLSTVTCRGYSTVVTELYYTGNQELYTGDIGII